MTKEQEEVIAAGRKYVAHWGEAGCEAPPPYGTLYRAVRALEESEKPKPKVWVTVNGRIKCSDGRLLEGNNIVLNGFDSGSAAREYVAAALNVYEEIQRKLLIHCCDIECVRHGCNKCCTCKST